VEDVVGIAAVDRRHDETSRAARWALPDCSIGQSADGGFNRGNDLRRP
jgi:hypothetical protein